MNKKNKITWAVMVAVFVLVLAVLHTKNPVVLGKDYKNTTYQIDGQKITLIDGSANFIAGDDSAPRASIKYFGNQIEGDFNNDGRMDAAFLLTQNNGGSGTFYYVVAALNTTKGWQGTNGIFLGDRIAPQTTEFRDGSIIVNYADRKSGEPMTAPTSVGISKYLKVENGMLIEIK